MRWSRDSWAGTVMAIFLVAPCFADNASEIEDREIFPPPVTSVLGEEAGDASFIGLRFSTDGRRIWSGLLDSWNTRTGERSSTKLRAAINEMKDITVAMDVSPDDRRLITAHKVSRTIRIWDVGSQETVRVIPAEEGTPWAVRFLGRGNKYVAWYREPPSVLVGHVDMKKEGKSLCLTESADRGVFTPDGRFLALMSFNPRRAVVWDVRQEKKKFELPGDPVVRSIAFGPQGRILATGGGDNVVRLWDVATGNELGALTGHGTGSVILPTGVYSLAFGVDGKLLASGGHDGRIKVWDVETRQMTFEATISTKPIVASVALSPDSQFVAAGFVGGGSDRGLCIWKLSLNGTDDQD